MSDEEDDVLRVGDVVEFHRSGNPKPQPEWQPQRIEEIRIVEEYDDKEGQRVSQVSWHAVRDYECLIVVLGTENWARNDGMRPASRKAHEK